MKRNILFITCLMAALSSYAATVNWDGEAGTTNWSDAFNWENNMLPTNADDVFINNATVQVNLNTFVRKLTLTGTTSLTVNLNDTLTVGNTTGTLLEVLGASSFTLNGGLVIFGNSSAMTQTVNINTTSTFTIANGGTMTVFGFGGVEQEAIAIQKGTFTNNGNITLSTGSYGIADRGASSFINGSTGIITMTGIGRGINYDNENAIFTNFGSIAMSPTEFGISLGTATNVLNNNGSVTITTDMAMIDNTGSGTFNNNTGGTLKTVGSGTVGAARFVNNGGTLAPGGATRGFMNFTGSEDFSKSTWNIDIAGRMAPGPGTNSYDQIVVRNGGTAALDNMTTVLNINFSFTPMVGDEFHIIDGAITGEFKTINVTPAHVVSFNYTTRMLRVESLLPVELVSFKADNQGEAILLSWQTASEINNEGFVVTRSADGKDWDDLDFVQGQGTSFLLNQYMFMDKKPLPGVNYYRLRQIDYDRNLEYSPTISEYFEHNVFDFNLFPNPASHSFNLSFPAGAAVVEGILKIFDVAGNEVWNQHLTLDGKPLEVPVNLSNYAPGSYIVHLKMDNGIFMKRLELVK